VKICRAQSSRGAGRSFTFNHGVVSSIPTALTNKTGDFCIVFGQAASKKYGLEAPWKQRRISVGRANEHIEKLKGARRRAVVDRRNVTEALTADYKRGHTENMRSRFMELQGLIETIDRAIADETQIESEESHVPDPGLTIKVQQPDK
jgi:hypothetical protein